MIDETPAERLRLACVEGAERLTDALAAAGFRESSGRVRTWVGLIPLGSATDGEPVGCTAVELWIPEDFPFQRPRVTPLAREAAEAWARRPLPGYHEPTGTWHLEPNGQMCLYEPADYGTLPWADPPALLEHTAAWLEADRAGWPDDPPALDLDRYFTPSLKVFLFDLQQLRQRVGQVISLSRRGRTIYAGNPVLPPKGRKKRPAVRKRDEALVLDLGTLDLPPRDLDEVQEVAGDGGELLARELRRGIGEVVLLYDRGGEQGVLALTRTGGASHEIKAHQCAPCDVEALMLRAHPQRRQLASKRVAIVGVGAIGSVVADLLHRSGVGHLHLIDADRVLPANLVRHLCGWDQVGEPKVDAVAATLRHARPASTTTVTGEFDELRGPLAALELLQAHDVVVDATADTAATRLLREATNAGAGRAVSVAVLADGYAVRVDRWPTPPSGGLSTADLPPLSPGVYETGCSTPISRTPPAAVWEAAALAARHVVDLLLDGPPSAGEERVLRLPPDPSP